MMSLSTHKKYTRCQFIIIPLHKVMFMWADTMYNVHVQCVQSTCILFCLYHQELLQLQTIPFSDLFSLFIQCLFCNMLDLVIYILYFKAHAHNGLNLYAVWQIFVLLYFAITM